MIQVKIKMNNFINQSLDQKQVKNKQFLFRDLKIGLLCVIVKDKL